jgi:hypothetical protein
MKPMILSDEHIAQMTEWFGPDTKNWAGKNVKVYRKILRDADGNKLGETIGICLPGEEPQDDK